MCSAWRSGASTAAGTHAGVRHWRGLYLERPGLLEEMHESGELTDEAYERWQARLAMTDGDFEAHLRSLYPGGRVTEPRLWRDLRFRGPAQPVVGICWYEARAYCLWLRAQSGIDFRLPTDAEWEAAARGPEGRAYAYGDTFDRWRANVLATHLRQTSPVGVFPDGDTPEGIAELTGNVNEWTSSAWGTVHESPDFGVPYDGADGRESADAVNDMRRVLRGGSWCDEAAAARADFRNRGRPDGWDYSDGFRLAGPASSAD